jgi:hypothetical protein
MKFITQISSHSTFHIGYREKYREETVHTKFLGLQIDNNINWKNPIEEMIPKLSGEYSAIRSMVHTSNINTLKSINYAYFHSFVTYGIILWSNSSNSGRIIKMKKQIIRIMADAQPRTSCRSLFKQLEFLEGGVGPSKHN